jgi:hypothetical protein
MKRFALVALFIVVGALISFAPQGDASSARKQSIVVDFPQPMKLLDVLLTGTYVFVHDEERMAQGGPCTSIYRFEDNQQGKLVVEFHCVPIERPAANRFLIKSQRIGWGTNLAEVLEYQFAGDTEAHGVPR